MSHKIAKLHRPLGSLYMYNTWPVRKVTQYVTIFGMLHFNANNYWT
jgi:hypothetical protein